MTTARFLSKSLQELAKCKNLAHKVSVFLATLARFLQASVQDGMKPYVMLGNILFITLLPSYTVVLCLSSSAFLLMPVYCVFFSYKRPPISIKNV